MLISDCKFSQKLKGVTPAHTLHPTPQPPTKSDPHFSNCSAASGNSVSGELIKTHYSWPPNHPHSIRAEKFPSQKSVKCSAKTAQKATFNNAMPGCGVKPRTQSIYELYPKPQNGNWTVRSSSRVCGLIAIVVMTNRSRGLIFEDVCWPSSVHHALPIAYAPSRREFWTKIRNPTSPEFLV